jgi:zinc transport system permease protein
MNALLEFFTDLAKAGYLPAMFEHAFMVRGMMAALIVGPVLGGMGTVVVTRKLAFFTQTVGNASLTGVALGLMFGEPIEGTYAGLYGFCLIIALLMTYVKNRARVSNDTVIGVVLAQVLGIGILMLVLVTKQFNVHQIEAILFGSLITLNKNDLIFLIIISVISMVIGGVIYNRTMLSSFNPILAKARGVRPVFIEYMFIMVLTAVIVASLKLVGSLLVLVLMVVPAAGAQNIAKNLVQFFWLTIAFSTVSTVIGLLASGLWPVPTGASIVLVASIVFYSTLVLKPIFGKGEIQQGQS